LKPAVLPAQRCAGCNRFVSGEVVRCPYCNRARITPASSVAAPTEENTTVFVAFAALLVLALAFHFADPNTPDDGLKRIAAFEGLSTVVVLACAALSPAPFLFQDRPLVDPAKAWITGLVLVVAAAFLNHAYHDAVRELIGASERRSYVPSASTFALLCAQPAVVEELYFRHLAFRPLRHSVGPHATVAITATMFGFAHVGELLGLPVLVGLGFLFGYARLASGSLLLPVVLHFVHNLLVLAGP
jgi:uncharacterized protein